MQGFFLRTVSDFSGANAAKFDVTKISTIRPSGTSSLRSGTMEESVLCIKAENDVAASYMLIGCKEDASSKPSKSNNNYSASEVPGSSGAGFFRSSTADDLPGRPGSGDAIGQEEEAPIGGGLYVLLACCLVLGGAKFYRHRFILGKAAQ